MNDQQRPVVHEVDFTRGLLLSLAQQRVRCIPDPRVHSGASNDGAEAAYQTLEREFGEIVEPRLYITTSLHGFASSWCQTIQGYIYTWLSGCNPDGILWLDLSYIRSISRDDLPGPIDMWDRLAAVFIETVENQGFRCR